MALRLSDHTVLWSHRIKNDTTAVAGTALYYPSSRYGEATVVFGTQTQGEFSPYGAVGLGALDADTGAVLWTYDWANGAFHGATTAPAVAGDRCTSAWPPPITKKQAMR